LKQRTTARHLDRWESPAGLGLDGHQPAT
jgi:hypothetical protein